MYRVFEIHLAVKTNNKIPSIKWKIVGEVVCDAKSNYSLLCLKKNYFIINYPHEEILSNKLSELIRKMQT